MAQDSDVLKSTDKGKGKAVEHDKADDAKKGKDGHVNGKKDDGKIIDGEAYSTIASSRSYFSDQQSSSGGTQRRRSAAQE
jgi:hypothetical protein